MSFNLQPALDSVSYSQQIVNQFPLCGHQTGYCGEEFRSDAPQNALYGINDRLDTSSDKRIPFFECTGTPVVTSSSFLSQHPWIIPFDIMSFKPDKITQCTMYFPNEVNIYGHCYRLAGFTLVANHHFTAIVIWRGDKYYYDGMAAIPLSLTS